MQETSTLIVGASASGLASASCLQKQGIKYLVIEKELQSATPWRNHYERLHLHTNKSMSNLPYKKFDKSIPVYPDRQQVVNYLDEYRKEFNIEPIYGTKAISIKKEGKYWVTETNNGLYKSSYIIMATGAYGKPKPIDFKGMETFPGQLIHSYEYKTGRDFAGQKVLVVGFGNSGCEIAIDLYEQGAEPFMSVRSPVNVIPRDLLGIPILSISLLMSKLPPRVADAINNPVTWLLYRDLKKFGLKKMPYGVFEQIQKDRSIPLLDIGTIKHIREGHITVRDNIDQISGKTVHFTSGKKEDFDSIIAAIGYYRNFEQIIHVEPRRFDDLQFPIPKQKLFGDDGLYFCGFWISPTGHLREIGKDAGFIAKDIARLG